MQPFISVRIVNIDHYLTEPGPYDSHYCPFSDWPLKKIPVLRIFGSTPGGQKTCVHIHQIYPYLYVPYPLDNVDQQQLQQNIYQFGVSLNKAIRLSYDRHGSNDQHIAAIVLVKGIPFYGYHVQYSTFLKIYYTNPAEKQRITEILQNGIVMNTFYQPYEAHLSFELQFLMDYNLFGMNWIRLLTYDDNRETNDDNNPDIEKDVLKLGTKFRVPMMSQAKSLYLHGSSNSASTTTSSSNKRNQMIYTSETVPTALQWDDVDRTSYCELEIDTTGMMIINRLDITERNIHADLDEEIKYQEKTKNDDSLDEKLVKSLALIWKDERRRRQERGISPIFSSLPQQTSDERDSVHREWSTESKLRNIINTMVDHQGGSNYNKPEQDHPDIMTAFQAVEALYSQGYSQFIATKQQQQQERPPPPSTEHTDAMPSTIPISSSSQQKHFINHDVFTAEAYPHTATTTTTPIYRHGVMSTPSRFRSFTRSTLPNVDENIMENLRQSQSFFDDDNIDDDLGHLRRKEDHDYDNGGDSHDDSDKSIDSLDETNDYIDDELLRWVEQAEQGAHTSKPIVDIAYDKDIDDLKEDDDIFPIRPRQLDFGDQSHPATEVPSSTSVDIEELFMNRHLNISELPPSIRFAGHKRKRKNIPQNDGANDDENDDNDDDDNVDKRQRHIRQQKTKFRLSNMSNIFTHIPASSLQIVKHPSIVSTTTMTRSVPEHRTTSVADGIEGETSTASQISSSSSSSISSSSDGHHQPNYFTKKITGMWSPRSGDEIRDRQQSTSFWTDPPQPISPTGRHVDVKNDNNTIEFSGASKQDDNNNLIELNKLNSNDDIIVECESRDKNNIKSSETYDEKAYDNKYGKSSDHDNNKNNCGSNGERYFTFALRPPIIDPKESKMTYQEPYYSNIADVPPVPKVFSAKEFKLISKSIDHLKPFDAHSYGGRPSFNNLRQQSTSVKLWTPATPPPTYEQVLAWAKNRRIEKTVKTYHTQIDCATGNDTYNFKYSGSKPKSKVTRIRDYLDLFSLEIHVNTKEKMMPDPSQNEVQVIFWCLKTEDENISKNSGYDDSYHVGIISLDNFDITKIGISGIDITLVAQEQDLLWALVDKVRHYDPDILVGYELHNSSWGYLIERALVYNINLMDELARVYCESQRIFQDPWGYRKASVFRITGRHMLNVWRLMRSEINLTSYRFENLAYNVLHRRVPHYSYATLTSWYKKGPAVLKNRLFHYYLDRVQMNLDLLDISEIINKISESARVFGIDFYSVITRGSQFKVESIMLRIAKPENFLMISPSRKQVAGQRAIECLPLVMEPISQYYSSPLLVLDFQSLYPSIMIAYNYCYSTCVGKIGIPGESSNKLGVGELNLPDGLLGTVMDHLNVSPNGVAFVKPSIRKSLLAKMLTELLETRVMVKTAMKDYKDDSGLSRLLNARQLTLKYVANVTYGYTSASFSGRMPCVEVADSIVQTGRETLERAIKLINENPTWGAKVVYGDTDSVFVSLPGKTRSEAFDIGRDIATTVTKMNPSPVKLKFEKVYHPSLLLAKKRYVGNKFEHQDEVDPVFETKGLEIVRRDGTAATQKIMEYCIKILFQTQDMSKVKEYLYEQWTKILSNRVSIQDFIIAKEVRLGTYRNLPHGAQVAHAQMSKDPRSEPQYGERVPYVVVNQGPNARLKDRVTKPETLLHDKSLRLDADYYIRKQIIAPLERVFNLVGVDVKAWYDEMPRSRKAMALSMAQPREWNEKSNNRIDQYYASSHCIVCSRLAHQVICPDCLDQPSRTVFTLISRQRQTQKRLETALLICQNCSGLINADLISTNDSNELKIGNTGYMDMPCDSLDCPVLYERIKACHDVYGSSSYDSLIEDLRQRG